MQDCIFCKIVEGIIPASKMYEDDKMLIIKDISPQAKCHYLLIPKTHFDNIGDFATKDGELLAYCLKTLANITDMLGLQNGYRLVTNKGTFGRQSVNHIHIHILGGEKLSERMC